MYNDTYVESPNSLSFFEGAAELQNMPNIAPVCQQTFTSRRTVAWNEPRLMTALEVEQEIQKLSTVTV